MGVRRIAAREPNQQAERRSFEERASHLINSANPGRLATEAASLGGAEGDLRPLLQQMYEQFGTPEPDRGPIPESDRGPDPAGEETNG